MSYANDFHRSIHEPEEFWLEEASRLAWFKMPEKALSQDENGLYRWFKGGKLNTSYLALDHHVANGRGEQVAVIYDSPVTGKQEKITFNQLLEQVSLFAGALHSLGVEKGDRVIVYMPMIPQTIVAMLACARLGAIHSVVFGGFSSHELAIRIDDAKPRVMVTASGGLEIQKAIPYKPLVDAAIEEAEHKPLNVVVFQRDFVEASMQQGRDADWNELVAKAQPHSWVEVDATDPLYILYTSGTTGKPKGVVRDNGGHAVALSYSMRGIYGANPGEVFWAASDVGWVVGHSYIVYAPLIYGCTTILYEGKPVKTPDAGAFWRVMAEHEVSVFFTAPTAIRAIKKEDPDGVLAKKYDLSRLRYIFLAGEHCDVPTYEWVTNLMQRPVIDHWWQTESGWPMLANPVGTELLPIKPGSAGMPVCGYDIQILNFQGELLGPNAEGAVAIRLPLAPGALPSLWENDENFRQSYLAQFPGYYASGDGGYKDEDGYVYITGRMDDIINVAGHRLSTTEMEEAVAGHPAVAECAVIGMADAMKGQIPVGFVVLKDGVIMDDETLEKELVRLVREKVGPVAAFKRAMVVKRLPKTRSGKILRKIMRAMADGKPYQAPSTIEDMSVLGELQEKIKEV
ncbi:MAG: propionyl-CoA synthetase [Saprospiraceae bacterium]